MLRPHMPLQVGLTRHAIARGFVVAPRKRAEILFGAVSIALMTV
jgi:hypothetical protein